MKTYTLKLKTTMKSTLLSLFRRSSYWILFALSLYGTLACQLEPELKALKELPPASSNKHGTLIFNAPEVIEVYENEELRLPIEATTQDGGIPIFKIIRLPEGASFDLSKMEFFWAPDFQSANSKQNLKLRERIYEAIFSLRSSLDPISYIERKIYIIVRNRPRSINLRLKNPGALRVSEGKKLKLELEVQSEDFPKGPFEVLQIGDLSFVDIRWKNDQNFEIESAKIDPQFVTSQNASGRDSESSRLFRQTFTQITLRDLHGTETRLNLEARVIDQNEKTLNQEDKQEYNEQNERALEEDDYER